MNIRVRRRWLQFNIRGLLLLTAAVAVASHWLPAAYDRFVIGRCPACGYDPREPLLHSPFCDAPRDDVYFTPGPEFKLSPEVAALKAYSAKQAQQNQ
jgi:hypothetical protein